MMRYGYGLSAERSSASRRLADLAKPRFLAESSKQFKLDFIALLETGRDNFTLQFHSTISGGSDFDWHCLPPGEGLEGSYLGLTTNHLRWLMSLWAIITSNFM